MKHLVQFSTGAATAATAVLGCPTCSTPRLTHPVHAELDKCPVVGCTCPTWFSPGGARP